ncbi:unnamed protein product [Amoebophrya sp. A120]|nr:unnamed protein product [Amoebophrya sp. A120]|eukprot:GSA120T00021483001.1
MNHDTTSTPGSSRSRRMPTRAAFSTPGGTPSRSRIAQRYDYLGRPRTTSGRPVLASPRSRIRNKKGSSSSSSLYNLFYYPDEDRDEILRARGSSKKQQSVAHVLDALNEHQHTLPHHVLNQRKSISALKVGGSTSASNREGGAGVPVAETTSTSGHRYDSASKSPGSRSGTTSGPQSWRPSELLRKLSKEKDEEQASRADGAIKPNNSKESVQTVISPNTAAAMFADSSQQLQAPAGRTTPGETSTSRQEVGQQAQEPRSGSTVQFQVRASSIPAAQSNASAAASASRRNNAVRSTTSSSDRSIIPKLQFSRMNQPAAMEQDTGVRVTRTTSSFTSTAGSDGRDSRTTKMPVGGGRAETGTFAGGAARAGPGVDAGPLSARAGVSKRQQQPRKPGVPRMNSERSDLRGKISTISKNIAELAKKAEEQHDAPADKAVVREKLTTPRSLAKQNSDRLKRSSAQQSSDLPGAKGTLKSSRLRETVGEDDGDEDEDLLLPDGTSEAPAQVKGLKLHLQRLNRDLDEERDQRIVLEAEVENMRKQTIQLQKYKQSFEIMKRERDELKIRLGGGYDKLQEKYEKLKKRHLKYSDIILSLHDRAGRVCDMVAQKMLQDQQDQDIFDVLAPGGIKNDTEFILPSSQQEHTMQTSAVVVADRLYAEMQKDQAADQAAVAGEASTTSGAAPPLLQLPLPTAADIAQQAIATARFERSLSPDKKKPLALLGSSTSPQDVSSPGAKAITDEKELRQLEKIISDAKSTAVTGLEEKRLFEEKEYEENKLHTDIKDAGETYVNVADELRGMISEEKAEIEQHLAQARNERSNYLSRGSRTSAAQRGPGSSKNASVHLGVPAVKASRLAAPKVVAGAVAAQMNQQEAGPGSPVQHHMVTTDLAPHLSESNRPSAMQRRRAEQLASPLRAGDSVRTAVSSSAGGPSARGGSSSSRTGANMKRVGVVAQGAVQPLPRKPAVPTQQPGTRTSKAKAGSSSASTSPSVTIAQPKSRILNPASSSPSASPTTMVILKGKNNVQQDQIQNRNHDVVKNIFADEETVYQETSRPPEDARPARKRFFSQDEPFAEEAVLFSGTGRGYNYYPEVEQERSGSSTTGRTATSTSANGMMIKKITAFGRSIKKMAQKNEASSSDSD